MAQISETSERVDYLGIIDRHPWLVEPNHSAILSPDTDGFLSGLLYAHLLNWKVVGYYDGKVLIVKDGIRPSDCVFLDVEIYKKEAKSVGQHMVLYNKRHKPRNWDNFSNSLQLNNLRSFDANSDFRRKYPLGTIHFLIGLLQAKGLLSLLTPRAIGPLLFADGVQSIIFSYTENCLEWFDYLGISSPSHLLHNLFFGRSSSLGNAMREINDFYRLRDSFNARSQYINGQVFRSKTSRSRTGHNLILSKSDGGAINLVSSKGLFDIFPEEKNRVEGFIREIGEHMGWTYDPNQWSWSGFRLYQFEKRVFPKIKIEDYRKLLEERKPLSFAITSGREMELTLEQPDSFN